ncbi:MAG: hypothetical protein UW43_C0007G0014 [Candidatus Yanofskybacteria bacterium GW2011_GWA1_44_21]|uniref:AI-2E family transporter n=2 Tax=Candidatus Yanofskyibacteriota TaxID=1752733 RepID=A0A1F8H1X0_9BACT|nr:MAG: hypothetical protein UW43_C0007G0014 [Candidatus Yanofskybacteria bacterium GW2011_GWA1_44_21]KKT89990.1 MAG: hypothetical protein UW90_C0009G0014 [Candidatus Yanofskybacteria bacterium GW2011_GWB1_45_11]OGN14723.1 MAG: hypothetical protein A3C01_02195 [Candidatus Yanofskybacteria bacterium RIFCSPHIGHO2_02_FULL_44_36b]OGN18319.1 MAG: hypothetical protein A3F50_00205 [Candidatus Yanofskybacteria bacterium RIFCSPHIGHO2_12_FULL_44_29b]OGN30896.1 MAG: hypothetical protein A3I96_01260 [Candi
MPDSKIQIEISSASILKAISVVVLVILLYLLKDVLIIFLFALIIASAISPFADWIEEKGFPRLLGVILLFGIVLGLITLVFSLVIPYFSQDIDRLAGMLPGVVDKISVSLEKAQAGAPRYLDFLSEVQNVFETLSTYFQQSAQSIVGFVVSIFGGLFSFVAILVISFYLSVMKKGIESFLGAVVPDKYEEYAISLWKRTEVKVGRWLQGQLLLSLIVGLMVYIGLSLLGIRFALILGVWAMLLEIIPIVGPVIAAIPAIILAFMQEPTLGLWVLIFYIVVQQIENHILVPLVLGKTIGLNPVVVIIALLVGAQLAGIPGMILSVPVSTVIVEIFEDMAREKRSRKVTS